MESANDWNHHDNDQPKIKVHVNPEITNRDTQAQAQVEAQLQKIFKLLKRKK